MKKFFLLMIILFPTFISSQTLNNVPARTTTNLTPGGQNVRSILSQRIPRIPITEPFLDALSNTVWVSSDIKRGEDFYLFFQNGTHSVALSKRGLLPRYPDKIYPLKMVSENPQESSAIVIVASANRLLYYSFKLLSPYYLLVSAGYDSTEGLQDLTIEDYFNSGYVLQLSY